MYIYDYRPLLTTSRRIEHGGERTQLLFHTLVLYTRLTAENKVALLEEARSLSLSFSLLIRCQIRWFTIAPLGISRPCVARPKWQNTATVKFWYNYIHVYIIYLKIFRIDSIDRDYIDRVRDQRNTWANSREEDSNLSFNYGIRRMIIAVI